MQRQIKSYEMFKNMTRRGRFRTEGERSRQISELQSDAAGVVAQAEQGPVEIRRYSEPIAYIESVDQHREHRELDAALNRAIWAIDLARAMADVKEGNFERWEKVAAKLRERYPKP